MKYSPAWPPDLTLVDLKRIGKWRRRPAEHLNEAQRERVRRLLAAGIGLRTIAQQTGIGVSAIRRERKAMQAETV